MKQLVVKFGQDLVIADNLSELLSAMDEYCEKSGHKYSVDVINWRMNLLHGMTTIFAAKILETNVFYG